MFVQRVFVCVDVYHNFSVDAQFWVLRVYLHVDVRLYVHAYVSD